MYVVKLRGRDIQYCKYEPDGPINPHVVFRLQNRAKHACFSPSDRAKL